FLKLFSFLVLTTLTGCEVIGPSVKVSGPKVIVDDTNKHTRSHTKQSKSSGTFCPPGQAKKGNC
ncbi:hypothetical protein DS885_05145, partial [Psychromonas sp. B3M02]|uniref:hypothetical protein n=1 Tax=Psychromonas sp. B3M02 TaxID=2267226 RepID=UPI000DEB49C7